MDRLRKSDKGFYLSENSVLERFSGSHALVNSSLELAELVGNGSVEGNHSRSTVGRRTDGAELEAVTGESERRSTVSVGVVEKNFWNLRQTKLYLLLTGKVNQLIFSALFELVENL